MNLDPFVRKFRYWALGLAAAAALGAGASAVAQPRDLLLGISEGTSGGTDHAQVIAKYGGLAEVMSRAAKQKVVVVFVREFNQLEDGLKSGRFDFMMARPSDYPARGIRDHGYRYVAHALPDGHCHLLVKADSPHKSLSEMRGRKWVFPERAAYMTKFCSAELRDQGFDLEKESVTYVREQASIPTYLQTGFAEIGGVASYSGAARNAEAQGLRVLHKSRAQPYFPMIAGKRVSAQQIEAIQKELRSLADGEAGRELLKLIGIRAFATDGATALGELLAWLEKK